MGSFIKCAPINTKNVHTYVHGEEEEEGVWQTKGVTSIKLAVLTTQLDPKNNKNSKRTKCPACYNTLYRNTASNLIHKFIYTSIQLTC